MKIKKGQILSIHVLKNGDRLLVKIDDERQDSIRELMEQLKKSMDKGGHICAPMDLDIEVLK